MNPSLSIDRVVKNSYALLRKYLKRLVGMSAMLIGIYIVGGTLVVGAFALPAGNARAIVASIVIAVVLVGVIYLTYGYQASVMRIVEIDTTGGELGTISEVFESVKKRIWPLFGMALFVSVVTFIGYLVFVIPGVFLALIWAAVSPIVVFEGLGFSALDRSQRLVKGSKWGLLGLGAVLIAIMLAIYLVFFLVVLILSLIFGAAGGSGVGGAVSAIAQVAGYLILLPIGAIVPAVVYFELRGIEGGLPPAAPAPPVAPAPVTTTAPTLPGPPAPPEPVVPTPPAPPSDIHAGEVPPPPPPPNAPEV